jgi:hypothetical protein
LSKSSMVLYISSGWWYTYPSKKNMKASWGYYS